MKLFSSSSLQSKSLRGSSQLSDLKKMFALGEIYVYTDHGVVTVSTENAEFNEDNIYFENEFAEFTINIWNKGGKTVYRTLNIFCKKDMVLYNIEFVIYPHTKKREFIFYKTFINAPAVAFIRCEEVGFYTGVENPFFTAEERESKIILSYQPSLLLKAGESYESEPQFIGEYKRSYSYIYGQEALNLEGIQSGKIRQRFFNPCEDIALDVSEVKAMRSYVWEYLNVIEREFDNILYFFFYPKKQYPETDDEISDYLDTIDRFKKLNGDIIAFNPLTSTVLPTDDQPYWELCPKGSAAEKILKYAQDKGLKCGFYIGCGTGNEGGNSALLPFAPQKKEWKKRDLFGNIASENCLACDEYLDWWEDVQKNTIKKYDLGYWAWDPGPGNGNDCYADNHGHLPGKGKYKGWRNSQKLLERLKRSFPKLFLQSFYGRKEYGIWGFRYFSQHEVYWEQTLLHGATLHNDFNDYRINAHGTRLQNLWSMNYRFFPAHIAHGLVTRMGERYYDPSIEKANDLVGWKYSLLSAIACCGSVTHCNLPDKLEHIPEMVSFYDKWISWAKKNYRFCEYVTPLSDNVSNGILDGFARINGDEGQIFLFNSSPLAIKKQLLLDQKIGLKTNKNFYLRILYCENTILGNEMVDYCGAYKMGDSLEIILPPYGAVVFEVSNTPSDQCIEKIPFYNHKIDCFYDSNMKQINLMSHDAFEEITISASVLFNSELKQVLMEAIVPNEQFIGEKTKDWKEQKLPFNLLSSTPNKLLAYIPFAGEVMPNNVSLRINGITVPIDIFYLKNVPFVHYAHIEDYVRWDELNVMELKIEGLAKNSFLGVYISYPDLCNGIETQYMVVDEMKHPSRLHTDNDLEISSIEISPDVIDDVDCEYMITVKTEVPFEKIEAVYCILPTKPSMPALSYNSELKAWQGIFRSGNRRFNIFLNDEVVAWIKSKDGGIGPKKSCEIKTRYVYRH